MNYYSVYFDFDDIDVDSDGQITEDSKYYIVETDDDDNFLRCVDYDRKGNIFEASLDIPERALRDLDSSGNWFKTPVEAYYDFEAYIQRFLEWDMLYPASYYEPAEYYCCGLAR